MSGDKHNPALVTVLRADHLRQHLPAQGYDPTRGKPQAFAACIRPELARNARHVRAAGIAMD